MDPLSSKNQITPPDLNKSKLEKPVDKSQAQKTSPAVLNLQTPTLTLPQEFMGVIDSMVKEGYETAQVWQNGKTGDQAQNNSLPQKELLQQMRKDFQVIREFIRELDFRINTQGIAVAQALNRIQVEQGGVLWQKLVQVLQKGIPENFFPKPFSKNFGNLENFKPSQVDTIQETSLRTPGKAILELLKAEIHPRTEHFLLALQILDREGLKESADRLRSYLRRRGDIAEDTLRYYPTETRREIFQPPLLKEVIQPVNVWYLLFFMGIFGISWGMGMSLLGSILLSLVSVLVMFVFLYFWKKK